MTLKQAAVQHDIEELRHEIALIKGVGNKKKPKKQAHEDSVLKHLSPAKFIGSIDLSMTLCHHDLDFGLLTYLWSPKL